MQIPLFVCSKKQFILYHDKFTQTDVIPQVAMITYNDMLSI